MLLRNVIRPGATLDYCLRHQSVSPSRVSYFQEINILFNSCFAIFFLPVLMKIPWRQSLFHDRKLDWLNNDEVSPSFFLSREISLELSAYPVASVILYTRRRQRYLSLLQFVYWLVKCADAWNRFFLFTCCRRYFFMKCARKFFEKRTDTNGQRSSVFCWY